MKKKLSIILTVVMVLSMAMPAFSATITTPDEVVLGENISVTILADNAAGNTAIVYWKVNAVLVGESVATNVGGRWYSSYTILDPVIGFFEIEANIVKYKGNGDVHSSEVAGATVNVIESNMENDTMPPVITAPDITVEATCPEGAIVEFTPTALDETDGLVAVSCNPVSGSMFPLGETEVTCTAKDTANNEATEYFTVTVVDTTAPELTIPEDVSAEATAIKTPVNLEEASATDDVDTEVTITNNAPEDGFPLGETSVTWTATDDYGNFVSLVQKVTIVDTTAPEFTFVPANVVVTVSGQLTQVDIGQAVATDIFPVEVTNDAPADGFPLGTTTVTWTATDTSHNTVTAEQMVTVQYDFSGFFQPINKDGSSIFKAGSTVPVKFALKDDGGNFVSTAVAKLTYVKITNAVTGDVVESVSTSAATTGNLFRYDATANQYIFNLSTKGLTAGTYQLTAALDDGQKISVKISLK